nr:glycosyltransferase family 4 protein [Tamlana fucoidanivorans]
MPKHLLIIGFVWPEPKSSAAGSRMLQLIETFKQASFNITFATACAKTDNAFNLESIGVTTVAIELNSSSFDDFIKRLNPNVVLFDRFMIEEQFGWRVAENCPNALRILDTEDLHCLRKGRHEAFKANQAFSLNTLFNYVAKREIASIYRCDLSLIISEAEMDILKLDFRVDESLLFYLPFMLDALTKDEQQNLPKFDERTHFITIGNFLHEPNYNAVLYLKETLWPLIRKRLPQAELHVYGAYVQQKAKQHHHEKSGFIIKGFAVDAHNVMKQAKVCLAPLRFGAGLKGKLIDAMVNGAPSVTTSVGAEGMFGDFGPNGFVADEINDFVENAVLLYEDKSVWEEKQSNGFQIINNRFNKDQFQALFIEHLNTVSQELQGRRQNNFTGQMLMHHTLQSTKFMSKWIEAKNRKI